MCLKYWIILLLVIKNPWVILLKYVLLRGAARTPLGRLQRPSDPSTYQRSALHLPFRHLAINLICRRAVATSMRKLQRKHRKMWRNATLLMIIFVVKNKGQPQQSLSNWDRTARKSSNVEDRFREHASYSSIDNNNTTLFQTAMGP